MFKCKRILCVLLLLVMIVGLLPKQAWSMSVIVPTLHGVGEKAFTALPGVYEMGDGYAVIWATNFTGTGYIKYTYGGTQYTVYDQRNGIVRTNDSIHVVKVPYAHLQGNSYTVYSTEVTGHSYAVTNYGATISAGPITLKKYDGGTSDFDVLVLTDTHGQLEWARNAAGQFSKDPDLLVFSGDIISSIESKGDIERLFNIMGWVSGGRYPVVYCRGNHETRGIYSTVLLDYFPTKTGEFYFDFRYGPLWGLVIDTGEDKEDSHEYYGNLANYKEYNQKQEAWLRTLRKDTSATYRLAIHHIPGLGSLANSIDFTDSIRHLGIQVGISGHDHRCEVSSGSTHSTYISGGYDTDAVTWMTLNSSAQKAYVTSKTSSGGGTSYSNYGINFSTTTGSVPSALSEPNYGTHAQFNPSGSSRGTISLGVWPTVFETGGDWYNVVWSTYTSSTTAKGSTGYVEYTYKGKTYQQFDEAGGYRRASGSIHSVRVPKEHLNNNTYKVGSFLVQYSYTNPTNKTGRYYTAGDYMESEEILFENRTADDALNLVVCPDIKTNYGDTNSAANAAWSVVNAMGTAPSYVVVNGDALDASLNTESDLAALLTATANVSGGAHPVIFSRGNSECRGFLATDLIKYLPTVTGEFYYSLKVGDYTIVNLDTGEDDPDNAIITYNGNSNFAKYGGRVFHDNLRKNQLSWVNSLSGSKLVAISHMPMDTVKSRFSVNFESTLKSKGAVVAVAGHNNTTSLKETVNSNSIYTLIPAGFTSGTSTASALLLSGQYAHINTIKYQNSSKTTSTVTNKAVNLSTGAAVSYSASQPPLSNGVYTVSTPGHLKWISDNCTSASSYSGQTFRLANDIDLMLYPFTPIGGNDSANADDNTTSKAFCGTFDGNGYSIKNVNIATGKSNVGFFGLIRQATVKNLSLVGGLVSGSSYVGGMVGSTHRSSVIQNCASDLIVHSHSGTNVGGITGSMAVGSQAIRCANYGSVSSGNTSGSVGGISGQTAGSGNKITSSYNRGAITAKGTGSNAGGILGSAGTSGVAMANCYNAADVNSCGNQGAIVSYYSSAGQMTVSNSYFAEGYNGATTGTRSSNSWNSTGGSGSISSKSQSSMKSQSFATTLSSSDYTYSSGRNDGYPIHVAGSSGGTTPPTEPETPPSTTGAITWRSGCSYTVQGGYLKGVPAGTSVSTIQSWISNSSGISISGAVTGGTITLTVNGTVVDRLTILILGDVNGDGRMDLTDYQRIKSYLLSTFTLSGIYYTASDMDENGRIDTTDLLRIKTKFLE